MNCTKLALKVISFCLMIGPTMPSALAATEIDLRIVVDTSQAMQDVDSAKLRASGTELLIRNLPDEAQAGIWSYDKYTRQVAKHGPATGLWKQVASIHSNAMVSSDSAANLPHALRTATWDLDETDRGKVHVVLFSNGVIASGAGAGADDNARFELLNEWASSLRRNRVVVHTISIGRGQTAAAVDPATPSADVELLKQIAHLSGGVHAVVSDKDALRETVLDIHSLATRAAQAQVDGAGRFQIAPGAERFTILWFARESGPLPLSLRTPQGKTLNRLSSLPAGRWLMAQDFEIVTIERPQAGWWQIEGPRPARLAVYGELDIVVRGLQNPVVPADETTAHIEIFSQGVKVDNLDFLGLLQVQAWVQNERDRQLVPVSLEGDGFQVRFVHLRDGAHDLDVRVIAPTFSRRLQVPFVVANPLRVEVTANKDGSALAWVQFAHADVDYGSLKVAARVRKPPGIANLIPAQPMPGGMWKIELLDESRTQQPSYQGIIEAAFSIGGNYLDGKGFFMKTKPQAIVLPLADGEQIGLRFNADGKRLEDPEPAIEGGDWEPLEELQAQNDIADVGLNMPVYQPPPAPEVMKLPWWLVGILSGLSLSLAGVLGWIYRPAPFSPGAGEAEAA